MGDFHLVHFIGVGKREGERDVAYLAGFLDVACGYGTVTLDIGGDVLHVDAHVGAVVHNDIHDTDGEFSAQFLTHDGGARFGNVYGELG